jgi:hypothetical protein
MDTCWALSYISDGGDDRMMSIRNLQEGIALSSSLSSSSSRSAGVASAASALAAPPSRRNSPRARKMDQRRSSPAPAAPR